MPQQAVIYGHRCLVEAARYVGDSIRGRMEDQEASIRIPSISEVLVAGSKRSDEVVPTKLQLSKREREVDTGSAGLEEDRTLFDYERNEL